MVSAGTGKSVLLREIIRSFCEVFPREQLAITASTGIASVNIGGTTLHSWAGIGLGKEPAEKLVGKIAGNKNLSTIARRWRTVRTLIIDESMCLFVLCIHYLIVPSSSFND